MENRELGPYRATKLWNEVIHLFQTGMPLKKHRRHMRCYEYCFTASEAVNWMHQQLCQNPNFKSDISREQTIQLLNKFLKNGVFEDLKKCKPTHPEEFKDNGDLYRFPPNEELAAVSRNRPFDCGNRIKSFEKSAICEPPIKQISTIEIEDVWKATIINRLQVLLELQSLERVLMDEVINVKFIIANMSQNGKNSALMLKNTSEDLPHWIVSALKCLATWPIAKSKNNCFPNYPGFEKDVFKVIKDYFQNFERPLMTDKQSDAILRAFEKSEDLEFESRTHKKSFDKFLQLSTFQSVENLMLNMTIGDLADVQKTSTPQGMMEKGNHRISEIVENAPYVDNDPEINSLLISKLPPNTCFETAFTSASPITRIIPQQNYEHHMENIKRHYMKESTVKPHSLNQECVNIACRSCPSLTEKNISHLQCNNNFLSNTYLPCTSQSKSSGYLNLGFLSDREEDEDDGHGSQCSSYYTADNQSCSWNEEIKTLNTDVEENVEHCADGSYHTAISDDDVLQSEVLANTSRNKTLASKEIAVTRLRTFTSEGRTRTIEILQLFCLLLPPLKRQLLYLLLRLMDKISSNGNIKLHSSLSNRVIMLKTFTCYIMFTRLEMQGTATKLVAFLMDNSEEIFDVPPALKSQINHQLISLSEEKMKYILDNPCTMTYCEQVTKQEYEHQRQWNSTQALLDLLDKIIQDPQISLKERRKRLKQFRQVYPQIYAQKLSTNSGEKVPSNRRKSLFKPSFLQKFKNLRI